LSLTVAHQYIEQITDEKVRGAIFGNVGTMLIFRIGAADAEFLEKEFTPRLTQEDLVNLPKFHFYIKLMIDGLVSDPFSARGLAPIPHEEQTGNEEKIITVSRERFSAKRDIVEDKIARWSQSSFELTHEPSSSAKKKSKADAQKIYEAKCSNCGTRVMLNFQPDGVRPVYCDDCFVKIKEQRNAGKPAALGAPARMAHAKQNVPRANSAQIPSVGQQVSLKELTKKKPVSFTK
jgi:CxxC-x17-CxxC domain-containing protein